jgi:hypothetical protein
MKRFCYSVLLSLFACFFWNNSSSLAQDYYDPYEDLADWTILVYLNADNSLYSAGLDDMKEMEAVGSTKKINVVVQFDGNQNGDSARYYIEKDKIGLAEITSKPVQQMGEVDMGDWKNLVDFVLWGIAKYPAKRIFIDVWNHGSGWLKTYPYYRSPIITGISYDDSSNNHISTPQLGEAMKEISSALGRKIDVYCSDACLMQMLEVGYEIKEYAKVIVGSEETEPGDGWPYDDFLRGLGKLKDKEARAVAELLVDAYGKSYSNGSQGKSEVTLSAIDVEGLDQFVSTLNDFTKRLNSLLPVQSATILQIAGASQNFAEAANRDLMDFINRLTGTITDEALATKAESLKNAFSKMMIKSIYTDPRYAGSNGLAIWLPNSKWSFDGDIANYRELQFAKNSIWPDFLGLLNKEESTTIDW